MIPDQRLTLPQDIEADEILASLEAFQPSQWGLPAYGE